MVEQRVKISDGYIEIQVTPHFIYDISLDQMRQDRLTGRLNWLTHLRAKRWFTREIEKQFLRALAKYGFDFENLRHPDGAA